MYIVDSFEYIVTETRESSLLVKSPSSGSSHTLLISSWLPLKLTEDQICGWHCHSNNPRNVFLISVPLRVQINVPSQCSAFCATIPVGYTRRSSPNLIERLHWKRGQSHSWDSFTTAEVAPWSQGSAQENRQKVAIRFPLTKDSPENATEHPSPTILSTS